MNVFDSSGYTFGDEESKANAAEALECVRDQKRGAFLVIGPPATGKSHFVRSLLQAKFSEVVYQEVPTCDEDLLTFFHAAFDRGYLWFDGANPKLLFNELPSMLSASSLAFRKLGSRKSQVRENDCVFFVTCHEATMSPDLKRRLKVIRMGVPNQEPKNQGHTNGSVTATAAELAAAFTEWDRRYREDPEKFSAEAVRLLKGDPESYGEACAPYFMEILQGIQG